MELVDIVRASYGYTDEYIIDKTFSWLYNAVALIRRREYDSQVTQAVHVAQVLSGKSKIKYWDDRQNDDHVWIEEEIEDEKLKNIGLGI